MSTDTGKIMEPYTDAGLEMMEAWLKENAGRLGVNNVINIADLIHDIRAERTARLAAEAELAAERTLRIDWQARQATERTMRLAAEAERDTLLRDRCRHAEAERDVAALRLAVAEAEEGRNRALASLQQRVGEWAQQAFPQSTDATIIAHLRREVVELEEDPTRREAVDCYLMLLHLAHRHGFDLHGEAEEKFRVCQSRTWGEPDAEGVVDHVRDAPAGQAGAEGESER